MARYKTKEAADKQINELTSKIDRAKQRLKKMEDELKHMIAERDSAEAKALYAAFKRSNKTYDQTMTFLGASVKKK